MLSTNLVSPRVWLATITLLVGLNAHANSQTPYTLEWVREIGSDLTDYGRGVAVDANGNAYIAGFTDGILAGASNGTADAYLAKYDPLGNLLWAKQMGGADRDRAFAVALDAAGNPYISGSTRNSLDGPNAGDYDAFLTKFDPAGNITWTRQLGTSAADHSASIAIDDLGNAFITGQTQGALGGPLAGPRDGFLAKFDSAGNLAWTKQFGSPGTDSATAVAVDGDGNPYISGYTNDALPGPHQGFNDAFITRYDTNGNLDWSRQVGTVSQDQGYGIAVDQAGNAYLTGNTQGLVGDTAFGNDDAILVKYDASGNFQWAEQIGTTTGDNAYAVAVDSKGNPYITGETFGAIGDTHAGSFDAFLVKVNPQGDVLWTQQLGTSSIDQGWAIATYGSSTVYVAGRTSGPLVGPYGGNSDAFIAKYVPEPSSLVLLGIGGLIVGRRRRV